MRIKNFIRKNYKIGIGVIIGLLISIVGVYASDITSSLNVSYDNSKSNLTSTNMQGAIDELNTKATTKITEAENKCPEGKICSEPINVSTKNSNIVKAYKYNQTSGSSNYCVTGEESTCKETTCINYVNSGNCPAGTIIKYRVNDSEEKYFNVLHDDGITMTMQQRESTVTNEPWYISYPSDNTKGPLTILAKLESATSSWTNVNSQTYQMGTTNFNNTNVYTGCDNNLNCTTNTYTLESRTARARMITLQEAKAVGCTTSEKSCPIWMYNYLTVSTDYEGTVNDGNPNYGYGHVGYLTMNTELSSSYSVYMILTRGLFMLISAADSEACARAVVVVNK